MGTQAIAQKQQSSMPKKQNVIAFKGSDDSFESSKVKTTRAPKPIAIAGFAAVVVGIATGIFGYNYGEKQATKIAAEVVSDIEANNYTDLRIKDINDDGSPEVILKSEDGKQTLVYDIKNAKKSLYQGNEIFTRKIEIDTKSK